MIRRILIRAGKEPFRAVSAEDALVRDPMGGNSGNLLFSTAAFKLLSTPGTEIVSNGLTAKPADADRINDEYDCFVLPLANAYRPSFEANLNQFTELIKRLRIPVVVVSSGAQSTADFDVNALRSIDASVTRFISSVLDRSATVGVRGEFTLAYLNRLGFSDVEVIGCPSMFMFGSLMEVQKARRSLGPKSRISVNGSTAAKFMGRIITSHHRRYPGLIYTAQGKVELERLVWGESSESAARRSAFPIHISHPMHQANQIRFFLDPWPWMRFLSSCDFSFGSRIHGNITALLAGTPAYVLAHDSRTLELARYFEIPHRLVQNDSDVDAAELYREADFTSLNRNHAQRFFTFVNFLEKNGLEHIYSYPDAAADFDQRMARVSFPPPVETLSSAAPPQLLARIGWLRQRHEDTLSQLTKRLVRIESLLSRQSA